MNRPIGGYFELELPDKGCDFPHALCPAFNSGRHAFEFILRQLGANVNMVYLPYYTCDCILEPLKRLNLSYQFYNINDSFEIENLPQLKHGQYIIANNYFGIKDKYIDSLFSKLGNKLIADNSQAFFAPERLGMKAFYSPRKFVGVPDGGFAWTPVAEEISIEQDYSTDRSKYLLRRIDAGASAGYNEFKTSARELSTQPMKKMSALTYRILSSINFDEVKSIRRRNYEILHSELAPFNQLELPDTSTFECPMIYPFMTADGTLRTKLIENQIFVATYWPNILEWCSQDSIEHKLAEYILPLPIDQRYGTEEMTQIIEIIKQ